MARASGRDEGRVIPWRLLGVLAAVSGLTACLLPSVELEEQIDSSNLPAWQPTAGVLGRPGVAPAVGTAGRAAPTTNGSSAAAGAVARPITAGTAAPATAGTSAASVSVPCGAKVCTNPAQNINVIRMFMPNAMLATPCCVTDGECGWITDGKCTPDLPKANCPEPELPFPTGTGTATACCIESSQLCGINGAAFGLGCTTNALGAGTTYRCDGSPAGGSAAPAAGSGSTTPTAAGTSAGVAGRSPSAAGFTGSVAGNSAAAGTFSGAAGLVWGSAGRSGGAAGYPGAAGSGDNAGCVDGTISTPDAPNDPCAGVEPADVTRAECLASGGRVVAICASNSWGSCVCTGGSA
ncbi:MAG: hypothetical protein ABW321_32090 [Polyangiales bacterium]